MKKSQSISIPTVWALSLLVLASASLRAATKPRVVETGTASMTAVVENIDYKTRVVTLKEENGQLTTLTVGPDAVRFDQVKKGDKVKVDYVESVAVTVHPPHDTVSSVEGEKTVLIRNKGTKPSGTVVKTEVVTATVEKIDAKNHAATLRMPDNQLRAINIAADVNLDNVKQGDQVVVEYTRSTAIHVTKS